MEGGLIGADEVEAGRDRKLAVFGVRNDEGSTKAVVMGIKLEG